MKLLLISIPLLIFLGHKSYAFDYFNSGINYWEEPVTKPIEKKTQNLKEPIKKKTVSSFNWKKHLNPKNNEFFKEGNHVPPAPFMELARNPTDQNIKNWFALIDKKNELATRLQTRIKSYLQRNKAVKPEEKVLLINKANLLSKSSAKTKRFIFRMYFESNCSHCKRMMETLKELQRLGFFVELRQIDKNAAYQKALPFPVVQATKRELKEKQIVSWPVLFIADRDKKIMYRLNGYRSTDEILRKIQLL